jgi:ABC-type sugar transport system substrate-binding protein
VERIVASFTSRAQEFQVLQSVDAQAAARRLGLEIEIDFCEGNAIAQIQYLFKHIHRPEAERPAALVVNTQIPDAMERVARNAGQSGIGWILLNRPADYIDPLRRAHPHLPIAVVTTDQREVGRIQARQARKLLPRGGGVFYVQGPLDSLTAQTRLAGFEEEAAAGGGGFTLKVINADWSLPGAERAATAFLRLRTSELFQPELVIAQNDMMAEGTRRSLEQDRPEWARLPFLGVDGLPEGGLRLVAQRRITATVVIPPSGAPAVELVARALRQKEVPPARVLLPAHSHPELARLGER